MPNTFDPDGKTDLMNPMDQYAYLKATGNTIAGGRVPQVPAQIAPDHDIPPVDIQAAQQYQAKIAAEDAKRRAVKKIRQTDFGMPFAEK